MNIVPTEAVRSVGRGTDESAMAAAVRNYAPDLFLIYRADTKDYAAVLERSLEACPALENVYTFGDVLGDYDEVQRRLYSSDVRRHGVKIFRDIQGRNDIRMMQAKKRSSEGSEAMAEAMLSGFRTQGYDPFHQSLRNLHPKGGGNK